MATCLGGLQKSLGTWTHLNQVQALLPNIDRQSAVRLPGLRSVIFAVSKEDLTRLLLQRKDA